MKCAVLMCALLVLGCEGWRIRGGQEMVPEAELEGQVRWSLGGVVSGSLGAVVNSTKAVTGAVGGGISGAANLAVSGAKGAADLAISGAKGAADLAISGTQTVVGAATDVALAATTRAVNAGVSLFLSQYKLLIKSLGLDEIPLPNIDLSASWVASFHASGGFFRSLSSLTKDGEILFERNGTALRIDVPLKFDDMGVGYRNYSWSAALVGTSGEFTVGFATNKVRITMLLAMSTKCALTLERVSFMNMEGLEVKFTGVCSLCGSMASKLATYITNFVQTILKNLIEDKLYSLLTATMSNNTGLCAKFISG